MLTLVNITRKKQRNLLVCNDRTEYKNSEIITTNYSMKKEVINIVIVMPVERAKKQQM